MYVKGIHTMRQKNSPQILPAEPYFCSWLLLGWLSGFRSHLPNLFCSRFFSHILDSLSPHTCPHNEFPCFTVGARSFAWKSPQFHIQVCCLYVLFSTRVKEHNLAKFSAPL